MDGWMRGNDALFDGCRALRFSSEEAVRQAALAIFLATYDGRDQAFVPLFTQADVVAPHFAER